MWEALSPKPLCPPDLSLQACLAVLLLAQDIAWLCNVQLKGWLSP